MVIMGTVLGLLKTLMFPLCLVNCCSVLVVHSPAATPDKKKKISRRKLSEPFIC